MKYLIVGLGNIGPEYQNTRHNIGFKVLDAFAKASNTVFEDMRKAVSYWMQKEKIELSNLFVVVDDLALPFGTIRLRGKGSDGGHNGLKNINQLLGTQDYARLRFGIGNECPKGKQVDYVLGEWSPEEEERLPVMLKHCGEVIENFIFIGVDKTMSLCNNLRF